MKKFEYEILIGKTDSSVSSGVVWYRSSNLKESLGPNLPKILNDMGRNGWEVATAGDVGFDSKTELILKREYE
ncbi:MAG: hypothetical protein AB8G77_21105 [Rhodothermales bacterium]